jgi:argininosuccinate synthase
MLTLIKVFLGQWSVTLRLLEALDSNLSTVGQEEDWDAVEKKALALGAEKMVILDLQKYFVDELVFRAIQSNAIYEDRYL